MKRKALRFLIKFLVVNSVIYLIAAFTLTYWPISKIENRKNYDFSSVRESASHEASAKEVWIKLRDGKEIFSRVYDGKTKDVLIFLHGSGSDSRYLSKASKHFADLSLFTVITPDLRGHGRNSGTRGDIDHIGQLEEDLEDIVRYAKENLHAEKIILTGHSSGGGLALRYLGNDRLTKVNGSIMFSPYLGYKSPTLRPGNGNWVTVSVKRFIGLSMLNNIGMNGFNGQPVLFFNRASEWNDSLQVASYSYRMAMSMDPKDFKADIKNIYVPTLVLVGGDDESFYPDKFAEVFSTSDYAETHVIKGIAHLAVIDNSESLSKIRAWLGNLNQKIN
ncbi:alpha/beta hydrolase [Pontibacter sp. MBLB2868]|uniref:alpha/beta hydrolase n=1 Tax=Pontibacter sp. MBLB2868 TaxID=3451555 RepID=UPI003F754B6E